MPEYTIEDKKTGKTETLVMSIAERDQYLKDNPDKQQIFTKANGFIPGVSLKPDGVFRDMLKEMKKAHPGSTINTY